MDKTMLEYALEYAGRGWPVFPLHTPAPQGGCSCGLPTCGNVGKHPRTMNGVKDATTDPDQIRTWWGMWPTANIGLATGGGLVVVDFDIDHDQGKFGDDTLTLLQEEHEDLPETVMAITGGGGLHYFFHCADNGLTIGQDILPGMDFRGAGGYVVAAPSLHRSGRRYEWEASHEPEDTALAELPTWLHDILAAGRGGKRQKRFEAPETITQGGRNGTLFRMASSLRAKGLSEAAITAAVWEENLQRCQPPLERREVETICASAGRYERGEGIDQLQAAAEAEAKVANAVTGTFEELTDGAVLTAALGIADPVEREKRLAELRGHAKELRRARDFERVLKAYQEAMARQAAEAAAAQDPAVIDLPDCPLSGLKCFGWEVDIHGVKRASPDFFGGEEEACSHPVLITERLTNIDTGGERVKLAFYRDRRWKDLIVDKSAIASRQKIIELSDAGVQVNSENARFLIQYLHDLEAQNAYRIPRKRCVSRLGWAEREFVPYVEDVQYDGDPKYASYFNAVRTAGDYDVWKRRVLEARGHSPVLRAALAASFASPLMWPLGAQVFFVHLWGGTEVGKSVAQMVAMSVWGDPDMGALLRSYNATNVAVERMAAFCHSIPLALDEQQTVRNNRFFNMDTLIYNICEGQGRGRGTKSGSLENMATWRLCVLSSGEGPLTSAKSGGGGKNRVLELYCAGKLFADAPSVADFVKENFGHAGRAFIEAMSAPGAMAEAKRARDVYRRRFLALGGGTEKQAASAAMLAVGDYYSSVAVFGMGPEEAQQSTLAFCDQLAAFLADASEVSQVERAYQWVCGWVAANPDRFLHRDPIGVVYRNNGGELWGKENDTGNGYLINAMVLDEALEQAGFIVEACRQGFIDRGYLLRGRSRVAKQRRIGPGKNGTWCYDIIMPGTEVGEMEEVEDNDPDAPWRNEANVTPFPGVGG